MKTYKTSAKCQKCGNQLYTSDINGYSFVCNKCNENFYTMEVKKCLSDFWEISVPMTLEKWIQKLPQWQEICEKYNCDFLGYDNVFGLMDIGWKDNFPESEILNKLIKEIEEQLKQEFQGF